MASLVSWQVLAFPVWDSRLSSSSLLAEFGIGCLRSEESDDRANDAIGRRDPFHDAARAPERLAAREAARHNVASWRPLQRCDGSWKSAPRAWIAVGRERERRGTNSAFPDGRYAADEAKLAAA